MNRKRFFNLSSNLVLLLFIFLLSACGPGGLFSPTATTTFTPSPTFTQTTTSTLTPTQTSTATITPTITLSPTPKPTRTFTPTPTPIVGTYNNPYLLGDKTKNVFNFPKSFYKPGIEPDEWRLTVLEVKTGNEANQLARQNIRYFGYQTPIEGQEYLGVYVTIEAVKLDENEIVRIRPHWSLTLRYEENGRDVWSVDTLVYFNEGYPPIEGSGWVFFLIREGSKPYLYFQPHLILGQKFGYLEHGVYFWFWDED